MMSFKSLKYLVPLMAIARISIRMTKDESSVLETASILIEKYFVAKKCR